MLFIFSCARVLILCFDFFLVFFIINRSLMARPAVFFRSDLCLCVTFFSSCCVYLWGGLDKSIALKYTFSVSYLVFMEVTCMAIVRGPLMSFDARGALGKTLVFLGWKGIKDVRQYVIPANPKSEGQTIQRGFLADAVGLWHDTGFTGLDIAAFNIVASLQASAMSGFNVFCKTLIQAARDVVTLLLVFNGVFTDLENGSVSCSYHLVGATSGKVRWGYTPSVMGNIASMAYAAEGNTFTGTITGIVGTKTIYIQPITGDPGYTWFGGIYKVVSTGGVAV